MISLSCWLAYMSNDEPGRDTTAEVGPGVFVTNHRNEHYKIAFNIDQPRPTHIPRLFPTYEDACVWLWEGFGKE